MVADIISFLSQTGTITVLLGYIFALWAALTIWTWFDIASRTDNFFYRLGAIILVALGFLLGFVIYLILRPAQTKDELEFRFLEEKIFESQSKAALCHNCGEVVEPEFSFCAHCGTKVRRVCENCERQISFTWNICPYCSHPQGEVPARPEEKVEVTEILEPATPRVRIFSLIRSVRLPNLPKFSLRKGGKKRGRPRKERVEVGIKRSRGRPRKEISPVSTEA